MQRILNFYRTQIELLWHWRLGRAALLKRAIVSLIAGVIAFNITAWLLPGQLDINELGGGLARGRCSSRPSTCWSGRCILALVASRSVVALVILTLLFQAFVIWLLDPFVPAVDVQRRLHRRAHRLVRVRVHHRRASACCFGLGEDDSYYGALVRTLASRRPDVIRTDEPGLVVIQLDGLSHDVAVALAARRSGARRWPAGSGPGTHRLGHWDALLPSTTPASQAGILHGNNDGIPNFRWWEKKDGRLLVANHPEDATEIERRVSNGEGLLSPGGASISNIFTGDGDRAFLVMSTIKVKERGLGRERGLRLVLREPLQLPHDDRASSSPRSSRRTSSRGARRAPASWPRMHRGFPYPWVRGATNVALRALGTSLVIQEMVRGTPVIYMDYTDYDEIAHHSGPERPGVARCARRRGPGAADAAQGRRGRAPAVPLRRSSPTTARAWARRSSSATA